MLRVAVVGNSGAGKTTVARAISTRLGVDHVELDGIFHQPGWQELSTDEFRTRVRDRLDQATAGWVVCGNYSAVTDTIWPRADTIVWLDLPRRVVTARVARRTLRRVLRREELWNGNREPFANLYRWDPAHNIVRWSWTRHEHYIERYAAAMADPRWAHLHFVRLRRPRDIDAWLATIGTPVAHGRRLEEPAAPPRPCVAILTALPSELGPVIRQFGLRREWCDDRAVHHGHLDPPPRPNGQGARIEIVALSTGVGMDAAGATTAWLLAHLHIDHVIVVGVAGGISTDLPVGHVVHPAEVLDLDTGKVFPAAPLVAPRPAGRLVSSAAFTDDGARHDRLRAEGVHAIDMETAAIAAVCARDGCPWSAFRGISDRAGDADDVVVGLLRPDGSADLRAAIRLVLTRPGRITQLVRLGRGAHLATNGAARAAHDACSTHTFVTRGR